MNAMLRERILPVGMGHTTNCFLQIEGTDKAEPYVLIPGSDEPKSIGVCKMNFLKHRIYYFNIEFGKYWQCSFKRKN